MPEGGQIPSRKRIAIAFGRMIAAAATMEQTEELAERLEALAAELEADA